MKRRQELDDLVAAFGRHISEAHANPERIGCPDWSVLVALANRPSAAEEFAAALDHICHCAPCLEGLASLRRGKPRN